MDNEITLSVSGNLQVSGRRDKPMKGLLFLYAAIFMLSAQTLASQQITRVAVLDMSRVLAAFPKDTAALKNFEIKKAEVQAEVDRKAADLKKLQSKKAEADILGDREPLEFLTAELTRKTVELKEYITARQNELDLLAKALSSSTSFVQKLGSVIALVAEAEGYSLVLNLKTQDQSANIVLWNSASIDITDKVIQALSMAR
jgi:outer membrane protein